MVNYGETVWEELTLFSNVYNVLDSTLYQSETTTLHNKSNFFGTLFASDKLTVAVPHQCFLNNGATFVYLSQP